MPISNDLLRTTFANLKGPLQNSFTRSTELWKALDKKAKMPAEGGTLIERSFTGASPAVGVGLFVGDEPLDLTRRQQIQRYQVEPHRLGVAISIPKKELLYNTGKLAVMKLIQDYPKTTTLGAISDLNAYLLSGVSRGLVFQTGELAGFLTLNGQFAAGRGTGVANGLLDFAAPAVQTDTVQNVAKAEAASFFNQYQDIGVWTTNGLFQLRRVYRACCHYSDDGGGPDLVIMDDETFGNFEQTKLADVRIRLVEDKTEKTNTLAQSLGLAQVYSSIDLNRGAGFGFTGVAADGVTFMLNTDYIEFPMHEAPNLSNFEERLGDQDVVTAVWTMMGNLIMPKFPVHGCVSGGAI